MKLSDWITAQGGRIAVARQLGVTKEAIHYWLTGKAVPRPKTILKILNQSGGKVSIAEIYAETTPLRARRGAK